MRYPLEPPRSDPLIESPEIVLLALLESHVLRCHQLYSGVLSFAAIGSTLGWNQSSKTLREGDGYRVEI